MLVTTAELLKDAVEKRYAVGGFDTSTYLMTEAILRAAEETATPLILMIPPRIVYGRSYDAAFTRHAVERCRELKTPVALHLDHATDTTDIHAAVEAGFSSVMIDASALSYRENVAVTRDVVRYAHARGVSVEAEIGHVGGGEAGLTAGEADAAGYTAPEDAAAFAAQTGVDLLAVAFGTVHGPYKGKPKLDLERLKTIRGLLPDLPLVMHGGSGLSDDDFRAAVAAGINKVNVFTEISVLYARRLAEAVVKADYQLHLHQALTPAENAVTEAVARLSKVFGTPEAQAFPSMQPFAALA